MDLVREQWQTSENSFDAEPQPALLYQAICRPSLVREFRGNSSPNICLALVNVLSRLNVDVWIVVFTDGHLLAIVQFLLAV